VSAVIPFVVGIASGERPAELQVLGIVLALAGVAVASREPADRGGGRAAGIGLALVAALGFGFYFVFADQAADASVPFAVATARGVSLAVAFVAALAIGASVRAGRSFLPALIVVGLCDVGANMLGAIAEPIEPSAARRELERRIRALGFDNIIRTKDGAPEQQLKQLNDTSVVLSTPLEACTSYSWRVTARAVNGGSKDQITVASPGTFVIQTAECPTATIFYQNFPNPFGHGGMADVTQLLDFFGYESVDTIPKAAVNRVLKALEAKKQRRAA